MVNGDFKSLVSGDANAFAYVFTSQCSEQKQQPFIGMKAVF